MRRTLIPPELRPKVPGSDIRSSSKYSAPLLRREEIRKIFDFANIVIIGSVEDGTLRYFRAYAEKLVPILVIYIEDVNSIVEFTSLSLSAQRLPGIYIRPCGTTDKTVAAAQAVLCDTLCYYRGRVLHRADEMSRNFSKPLQLSGLVDSNRPVVIPKTMIGHAKIWERENQDRIVKSISSTRSTVTLVGDCSTYDARIPPLCMTQERVFGNNIRVHCFNGNVYAWKIATTMLDYRIDDALSISEISLPTAIKEWCLQAAQAESLIFCGIDFIATNEEWVCLEVNPLPGYHFYELRLTTPSDKPLTSAIFGWLQSIEERE